MGFQRHLKAPDRTNDLYVSLRPRRVYPFLGTPTPVSFCLTSAEPHLRTWIQRSQKNYMTAVCSGGLHNLQPPPLHPAHSGGTIGRQKRERKQKRGKCGGIRARLAASPHRPAIPTINLANVHSLDNKLDHIRLLRTSSKTVHKFLWKRGSTTASRTMPFS